MIIEISKKEKIVNILAISIIMFVIGKIFYGNVLFGLLVQPLVVVVYKERKKQLLRKKREKIELQFKDMLVSMCDAINVGYSVENAISESYKDMERLYGKESEICREIKVVISKLKLNVTAEKALYDFCQRIGSEDAKIFWETFSIAKRSGGRMETVFRNVTDNISLKQSIKEEIMVAMNEKKFEQNIMSFIPIVIVLYVSTFSAGFLDVMYETILGKIVMTVCLLAYVFAYLWGQRIMEIKSW